MHKADECSDGGMGVGVGRVTCGATAHLAMLAMADGHKLRCGCAACTDKLWDGMHWIQ